MSTPGQQSQPYPGPPQPRGNDRALALIAHLSPLVALVLSAGFLSFLGPLADLARARRAALHPRRSPRE